MGNRPPATVKLRRTPSDSLERLADVELQLICHYTDVRSKLRLARCSTRLMHAVMAPFAWKGSVFCVSSRYRECFRNWRLVTQNLIPIKVVWDSWLMLQELQNFPPIRQLQIMPDAQLSGGGGMYNLEALFSESLQHLQLLDVQQNGSTALHYMPKLAHLHTLLIPLSYAATDNLCEIPSLTSLTCTGGPHSLTSNWISSISKCTKLKHLCLSAGPIHAAKFRQLFGGGLHRTLESLEMNSIRVHDSLENEQGQPTSDVMSLEQTVHSVVESLIQLRTLTLKSFIPINLLVSQLSSAPALVHLTLHCPKGPPDSKLRLERETVAELERNCARIQVVTID
jgi:hypothetical protein